jgi:endonuclease III
MTERKRASAILERLREDYEPSGSMLTYRSAWELLVATILAARAGRAVNKVTPGLFCALAGPAELATAEQPSWRGGALHGFSATEAKNLIALATWSWTSTAANSPGPWPR